MKKTALFLIAIISSCAAEAAYTEAALGPTEYWYIVDWPLTKTSHTADDCHTQDIGDVTYTVEYPYAWPPLVPVILQEPLWDCASAVNDEVLCEYLADEDFPLINMAISDETEHYVEIWWDSDPGVCHYVFEPG